MFEIIKNLPIPEKLTKNNFKRREPKYPFADMEIGDCLAFNAESIKDPTYKKIYGSAMSYARRVKQGYAFRFGRIDETKFGCWKVESKKNVSNAESPKEAKRTYTKRGMTTHITKEMLISALESEGTLMGASRLLNISSRTFSRLKLKYELI
jgi:hypothetical protein